MYDWDEAKREWTLETRGLDFADMARFDWDSALSHLIPAPSMASPAS